MLAGGTCLLLGLLMPAAWLIGDLSTRPTAEADALRTGASLAKLCLVALAAGLGATGVLLRRDARHGLDERGDRHALSSDASRPLLPAWDARTAFALTGVLGLAAVLRAIGLGSGLWYDEVVTLVEFVRLPVDQLLTTYTTTNNHILFSLLAHASVESLGESAFALRLPAAAFGVASVGALWLLGQEVADRRQALLAALLLSVSYHHVWFSQNARGYTGLLFFSLLGSWLFVAGMRRRSRTLWLAYALVFALAMFTHLSAVFLFASHALIWGAIFLYARSRSSAPPDATSCSVPGGAEWWPIVGFGLGSLLILQLYSVLAPGVFAAFSAQAANVAEVEGAQTITTVASWKSPLWTALEIARGLRIGFASAAIAGVAMALGAAGFLSYARRDRIATAVFLLPFPITLGTLIAISFHIWPRYFFVLVGFLALVLVRGAFVIAEALASRLPGGDAGGQRGRRLGTALALFVTAASAFSLAPNYRLPKQDYAAARDHVESQRLQGEPVVTMGLASYPFENYYAPDWLPAEDLTELDAIAGSSERHWLVYSFPKYLRVVHPGLFERLASNYESIGNFPGTLGDGTIYLWRSKAESRVSETGVKPTR